MNAPVRSRNKIPARPRSGLAAPWAGGASSRSPQTISLLLLLLLGLGLWLIAVLPRTGPPATVSPSPYHYQWLAGPERPEGLYRLDSSLAETGRSSEPPHLAIFTFQPIAINRADVRTLAFLPGIGPTLAQRIVDHRESKGFFASSEDLLQVRGIGPKTLERIRPQITID